MTTTLETIDDFRRHGHALLGHCGNPLCGRCRALDLDALADRYGADYSIIGETRIRAALVCSACGHRGGSITIQTPAR